jgi:hypothetical protein
MDLSTLNTKQVGEKMADNYLITGYWGEPHVTVENDRGFNAAVFGTGKFVLPVGEMFRAEYIGNNIVRIYDGKLIDNGAVAGIPAGEYIEFSIPEAGQGMKRNDLIVFEYSRNDSTLVESGVFKVIPGVEANETAVDPVLTEDNLLSNIASFDQMALWRVPVSGAVISAPEILYNTRFAGERIANVTSTDGKVYTANLPGVAKLYNGLEITIIPDITSTTTLPSLNINGIGAVNIKRRITSNTRTTVQSEDENFLYKDQPIRLIYNGSAWVADMARANVNDLYGTVPVEKGGTGADNAEEACENLGAIPTSQKGSADGIAPLNENAKLDDKYLPSIPVSKGGTGAFYERKACNNLKAYSLDSANDSDSNIFGGQNKDFNDYYRAKTHSLAGQGTILNSPFTPPSNTFSWRGRLVVEELDSYYSLQTLTVVNADSKIERYVRRIHGSSLASGNPVQYSEWMKVFTV